MIRKGKAMQIVLNERKTILYSIISFKATTTNTILTYIIF